MHCKCRLAVIGSLLATLIAVSTLSAEEKLLLWPAGAPGAKGVEDADKPNLTIYPAAADKSNGAAVVICPGGGYGHLSMVKEGEEIARWLNSIGVSGYVLQYRVKPYMHPSPMLDVQRGLRIVRSHAQEWGVNPAKIGILGFSAGGHLASTAATHFDDGNPSSPDAIEKVSCRPDFAVLCYPVVTFAHAAAHKGSRTNLLGAEPSAELIDLLSNEKQVTAQTPPTFLWHTSEDKGVTPENSILFYLACIKAGVPAEMHIYEKGPHGIGLAKSFPAASQWPVQCEAWMRGRGLLDR